MDKDDKKVLIWLIFSRIFFLISLFFLVNAFSDRALSFLKFLETFAWRWDGAHYLTISQEGYTLTSSVPLIAFLPFYPLVVKLVSFLIVNPAVAGILLSNFFFILGGFLLYRLFLLDFPKNLAARAIIILSLFPTSYFLSAAYPESLFLCLFALIFILIRQKKFLPSAFLVGLATLTRPFGILLLFPLLFEWWLFKENKRLWDFFPLLLPSFFSISIYLIINYQLYGDFFAFQKQIASFPYWHQSLAFPWQAILKSWQIALFTPATPALLGEKIIHGVSEALSSTIAWLLIPIVYLKLRRSYFIYSLLTVIFFTSTGYLMSTPRHWLAVPSFFIVLAYLFQSKIILTLWTVMAALLMFLLAYLFTVHYWFVF